MGLDLVNLENFLFGENKIKKQKKRKKQRKKKRKNLKK